MMIADIVVEEKYPFKSIGKVFIAYIITAENNEKREEQINLSIKNFLKKHGNFERIFYDEKRKILAISGSQLKILERKKVFINEANLD